jgi:hypothetical protein|tara:strand:+ start:339 stop:548 length:210 start_codon:yes stop_codon:yes gene_type:complete
MKIQEAQELRKQGYWIKTNRNFTKVLETSKTKPKFNNSKERIFGPLTSVKLSKEYQDKAWKLHCKINRI